MMIYCVEDDASIRELVLYTLRTTGYEAVGFGDGKTFMEAFKQNQPDLVLLDIMLPGEDGVSLLKKIRGQDSGVRTIPVILVTAKGTEYDKVMGLDSGADDYITKPFGMMELISRIKAVLRRVSPKNVQDTLQLGEIILNVGKHTVYVENEEVALTFKEFELLRSLMENQGVVLSRDKLLEMVWGYDFNGETRTVDVHVRTLRQKLGEAGRFVQTVRGVGYRMEDVK